MRLPVKFKPLLISLSLALSLGAQTAPDPRSALKESLEQLRSARYFEARRGLLALVQGGQLKDDRLYPALFRAYFRCEEFAEARALAKDHPEILTDGAALLDYVGLLQRQGAWEDSAAAMRRAPRGGRYAELQYAYLRQKGDFTELRGLLLGSSNLLPPSLYREGKKLLLDEAVRELEKVRERGDVARGLELCQAALALQRSTYFVLQLAALHYRRGDFREALEALRDTRLEEFTDPAQLFQFHKIRGMALAKLRRFSEALGALKLAKAAGGMDFDLAYYLAEAHERLGELELAEERAKDAVALNPGREGLRLQARILVAAGKNAPARDVLARYLALAPDDAALREVYRKVSATAAFDEGNRLYRGSNYEGAVASFEKAAELFPPPAHPVVRIMWANALYLAGEKNPAKRAEYHPKAERLAEAYVNEPSQFLQVYDLLFSLASARSNFERTGQLLALRQKILKTPDAPLLLDTGYQYELQKDYARALEAYEKAYALAPGGETRRKLLLALCNLGADRLNRGLAAEAEALVARGEKLAPKDSGVLALKRSLLLAQERAQLEKRMGEAEKAVSAGNHAEALRIYREVEARDPAFPELRANIASALFESKKYAEALVYYRSEDDLGRGFYPALGVLYCLHHLGRSREALALLPAAQARFPGLEEGRDLVKFQVQALRALGDLRGATEALRERAASDPGEASFQVLLGNLYFEMKDYDRAEACYARGGSKRDALLSYNLGVVQLKRGNLEEALRLLGFAAEKTDRAARVELYQGSRFQKVQCLFRLKRFEPARAEMADLLAFHESTAEGRAHPNVEYLWWWAMLHAMDEAKTREPALRERLLATLDRCIQQKENRPVATRASYLRVLLDPATRLELSSPVRELRGAAPHCVGDLILYQNRGLDLLCVSEESGATNWRFSERVPLSAPLSDDGRWLACALENGFIQVLDLLTGAPVYRVKAYARAVRLVDGDLVTAGASLVRQGQDGVRYSVALADLDPKRLEISGNVAAVVGASRTRLFDLRKGAAIFTADCPARSLTGFGGPWFYAVEADSNHCVVRLLPTEKRAQRGGERTLQWELAEPGDPGDHFLLSGTLLVHAQAGGALSAWSMETGKQAWRTVRRDGYVDALESEGAIYLTTKSSTTVKVRAADGAVLWEQASRPGKEGLFTILAGK
ncbi:MAG: tetratricopeptide repeat protein [Spirochaetes bacterium]|nr:tetratricopeptide repeat protein [Spirochaetota bacterium]